MKFIPLSKNRNTIVDDDDFEFLKQWKWYFSGNGYAVRKPGVKVIHMHRIINKTPAKLFTDHINGNKLDNRKANLRTSTKAQNCANAIGKRSKSGIKGVYFYKGKWRAYIATATKKTHLGSFETKEQASQAYNEAAIKKWGTFARLNKEVV